MTGSRPCCQAIDRHFSAEKADDLEEALRSNGPPGETQLLVTALTRAGVAHKTVLDVGAGTGLLTQQLLEAGARRAVLVDISNAYLAAAAGRLTQAGLSDRVQFRQGDVTELAAELADADVVTLDKVICCYPDARALIASTTRRALHYYAASYPRDRLLVRLSIWFENLSRRLRGNPFRAFVHPIRSVEALIRQSGFEVVSVEQTFFWRCALFIRTANTQ